MNIHSTKYQCETCHKTFATKHIQCLYGTQKFIAKIKILHATLVMQNSKQSSVRNGMRKLQIRFSLFKILENWIIYIDYFTLFLVMKTDMKTLVNVLY